MGRPFASTLIYFHEGETWRIDFSCHNADQTVMPLPIGSTAQFRIADNSGPAPVDLFTVSTSDHMFISDAPNGLVSVVISDALQTAHHMNSLGKYSWEFRVITTEFISVQAAGILKVLPSLFSLTGP
jgi:hypothetical protein